jgi:ribosomal protein S12 methylthiotransferase accessory factor
MIGPGQPDTRPGTSVTLKRYRAGTHRLTSPEATLDEVRRFFPVLGITRIADITGLDTIGIPVVMVCRPNSRSIAVSLGKALDLMAAKASGVMESVEAFMAERIIRPLVLGSFNDLRFSHPLIDVGALPRTATSLYHSDLPILWIQGQELFSSAPMWVPYETVHTAYTLPTPTGTGAFIATSNGLASGNHYLEALSHAICEVAERDAATLHNLRTPAELAARRLDPGTVGDADCAAALDRLGRAGMSVQLWDMTTDVAIPAFTCSIAAAEGGPASTPYPAEGTGCHPDRDIALLRALTEAAQSRLAYICGGRDELTAWSGDPIIDTQRLREQAAGLAAEPGRDVTTVPTFEGDSFDADVAWELRALRLAGIGQVVVVDLTREEFGIPVVRVVIPGLEGPAATVPDCRLGQRAMAVIGGR